MPISATPPASPGGQDPVSSIDTTSCEVQNQITAPQTVVDGCPVLPKMQCHQVSQGQDARLLWSFKDAAGEAIDLTSCVGDNCGSTTGDAFDAVSTPPCGVSLRMRELSGYNPKDLIHEIDVDVIDSSIGSVRAQSLPDAILRYPGVYQEEWAVFTTDNRMLFSNSCITFVNRGLFGVPSTSAAQRNLGPPTIQEIRLSMRDNAGADNLLLDDIEFDSAEIAQAVLRPIQYWNEIPPPIRPVQTTKTFPFREMWMLGIQAYLLEIASHNYRRNQLSYAAGGVSVDDKNKDQPYSAVSARLLQRFQEMCRAKKIEINISLFSGSLGSPYGGLFY